MTSIEPKPRLTPNPNGIVPVETSRRSSSSSASAASGAFFLAAVAVLPDILIAMFKVPALGFGGTSVLIVVGVALDTLQQVESHLLMRHYEGFVKRGRIRGRSRM